MNTIFILRLCDSCLHKSSCFNGKKYDSRCEYGYFSICANVFLVPVGYKQKIIQDVIRQKFMCDSVSANALLGRLEKEITIKTPQLINGRQVDRSIY